MTKRDRAFALQWAESLPAAHCGAALGPVLLEWFKENRTEVMDYLAGASSTIRQGFGTAMTRDLLNDHPQEALDWMQRHMGYVSFPGGEGYLAKFTRKDQAAATAWVLQLPPSQSRVCALRGLTQFVTFRNKTRDALAWIDTLPGEVKLTAFTRTMELRMLPDSGDFINYLKAHAGDADAADYAGLLGSFATVRRADLGGASRVPPLRQNELEQLADWAGANPGPVSDRLVMSVFTALPGGYHAKLMERLTDEQRALAVSVSGKK